MTLEKVYLFLIVLLTGSAYVAIYNNLIFFISCFVLFLILVANYRNGYKRSDLVGYLLSLVLLFFVFLVHFLIVPLENDAIPYINLFLKFSIFSIFILYLDTSKTSFVYLLSSILKIICLHAIIAFFLSFFSSNYIFTVQGDGYYTHTLGYLFFYNSSFTLFGFQIYRNQGLFWEPGILQLYMNILFFISSFIFKSKKFQLLTAFIILTTYSTTGIAILILQFSLYFVDLRISFLKKLSFFLGASLLTIPLFIINYTSKISTEKETDVNSSVLRFYDIYEGYNVMTKYPFTGIGLSSITYDKVKISVNSEILNRYSQFFIDTILERKSSNSVMYFITRFGILIFIFWFLFIYKQTLIEKKKQLFFFLVIVFNFSEPLFLDPLFLLIFSSGIQNSFKFKIIDDVESKTKKSYES